MGTYKSYTTGFLLSIVLTLCAYFAVTSDNPQATLVIFGLAVVQLMVQLAFFLHLGKGADARARVILFSFTLAVVFIIVGGSLWIMANLNYNMTPDQMNANMLDQAE